jgi:hypothetical protein
MALKRCIPTGKAKGFNSCNDYVDRYKYGMCEKCFKMWFKTSDGIEYAFSLIPRAKKRVQKENKEKDKKAKIENKSIAVLILEARQPFQKLIRIRDHRKGCICCKNILPFEISKYDGGHYYSAEQYTGLIFHPDNCHGQMVYCNQYLHGNESGYTNGLIKRIGWEQYNKLNSIKDSLKSYKWDRYKLIEMKAHYQKELREVEKGLKSIDDVDWSIGIV